MAGSNKTENEKPVTIVIKRVKKVAGGHHGGAWKVAYADFVTAMMAFFLLLWLLNVTTEEQKNAISNYFDPSHPKISDTVSGAGGLLGGTTMSPDGAMTSTVQPIVQPEMPDTTTRGALQDDNTPGHDGETEDSEAQTLSEAQLEAELRKKEDERFKVAADTLKASIANSPELKDLANNLLVDITPEGLRIQIVDDKGRSMFPSGSAAMYDFMRQLLLKVTAAVKPLPNQVSVRGHTDSVQYRVPNTYDNWNLSADRAQASRRVMVEGGLPDKRIENVMGRSDRDHLLPKEPANPRNRRISIILMRDHLKQPARPLPTKASASPAATSGTAKPAAGDTKPKGIQIIDDTVPAVRKGGATSGTATGAAQEAPEGVTNLPVTPGGTRLPYQAEPQVMTFGEGNGAKAAPSDGSLYEGPAQSPFVTNKPPTITTPLFNLDTEHSAPLPGNQAPAGTHSTTTLGYKPAAEAPAHPAPTGVTPKVMTFGDAETMAPAAEQAPAPSGNKVLTFP